MAGQTQTLLQSLVAQGLTNSAGADGTFATSPSLYIGRGVPDAWITPGQTHLRRQPDRVVQRDHRSARRPTASHQHHPRCAGDGGARRLSGDVPASNVQVQLPAFADEGVQGVDGGKYDAATETVKMNRQAAITLGNAAKPTVNVQVASTVPGTHTQPTLQSGTPTTATATVRQHRGRPRSGRELSPCRRRRAGPTRPARRPASDFGPGQTETVTFDRDPARQRQRRQRRGRRRRATAAPERVRVGQRRAVGARSRGRCRCHRARPTWR